MWQWLYERRINLFFMTVILITVGLLSSWYSNVSSSGVVMKLSSAHFVHGQEIPQRFTCEGEDISPELSWTAVPGTVSYVLICDDPDAPQKCPWVHWVVFNLPSSVTHLPEHADITTLGGEQGVNSWNKNSYGGPCPPTGRHRYFFKVYALDTKLSFAGDVSKMDVYDAMQGHVIEQAELIGTYEKKQS